MEAITTDKDHVVLIVSDAHLPLDGRQGGEAELSSFRELIQHYEDRMEMLILLGDIFDFWYEWTHVIPKRGFKLFRDINRLVEKGIPVHYFAGNHDFKVKGFLDEELGIQLHMDSWITMIDGKRVYFHHGDGMAKSDVNYRKMKSVLRNPFIQRLFSLFVHPDLAMQAGKEVAGYGRRKDLKTDGHPIPLEEYHTRAQELLNKGNDLVVFGHTHTSELVELENGWFHNPGPFLSERSYSLIDGSLPHCERWK